MTKKRERKQYPKVCVNCGIQFAATYEQARFHSPVCQHVYTRKLKVKCEKELSDAELRKCRKCGEVKPLSSFPCNFKVCSSCWHRSMSDKAPYIDISGKRYGRLVAIERIVKDGCNVHGHGAVWLCRCDCGNNKIVSSYLLRIGSVGSCGKCEPAKTNQRGIAGKLYYCKNCGKPIIQGFGRGSIKLHCDDKCRREYDRRNQVENKYFAKNCLYCGKEYKTNFKKQKYCSNCRGLWRQGKAATIALETVDRGDKICNKCGMRKSLANFSKNGNSYDGYSAICKQCASKAWAKRKVAGKIKRNIESVKKHREHDRIRRRTDSEYKTRRRDYEFMRRATDPAFRLKYLMKCAIWKSLRKGDGNGKSRCHWESLVGFTLEELRAHLEAQFRDGMSWDNIGKWHIDHVIPISFFTFSSPDDLDFKSCWALENLQPLWAKDNLNKHDDLP